ncbi:hypothetical protein [Salinibius halmophilus]|uniref:hypothetical protein n=1 Tax=Salinibius halmophilus TaxID=1853216 RepID=UPI000E663242|nr:hypothetical protein [Salinibius halmophilus]
MTEPITQSINWLTATKDVVSIVGALGALTIGSFGLFTWRRQLQGTSEYELAKKAVLKAYELQNAIQAVRNPMLYLKTDEVESGNHVQAEQQVYDDRMAKVREKWAELQTVRLEAKVIWGGSAADSFNELQECIGKLNASIWLHFWMKGAYAGPAVTVDNNPQRVAENDKVIYYMGDDDEFSQKLSNAVASVEGFFGSKIRAKKMKKPKASSEKTEG